jgi:hypothetical protein
MEVQQTSGWNWPLTGSAIPLSQLPRLSSELPRVVTGDLCALRQSRKHEAFVWKQAPHSEQKCEYVLHSGKDVMVEEQRKKILRSRWRDNCKSVMSTISQLGSWDHHNSSEGVTCKRHKRDCKSKHDSQHDTWSKESWKHYSRYARQVQCLGWFSCSMSGFGFVVAWLARNETRMCFVVRYASMPSELQCPQWVLKRVTHIPQCPSYCIFWRKEARVVYSSKHTTVLHEWTTY